MLENIKRYISKCELCTRCKRDNSSPQGVMYSRKFREPWESVFFEIRGPLPRSINGKCYSLVCEDTYTRYLECHPLSSADGPKIVKFLNSLINRWGTPKTFLTDNGTEFINRAFTKCMKNVGSIQLSTIERVNRNIKTMIESGSASGIPYWKKCNWLT